jgi:hypothetical protein
MVCDQTTGSLAMADDGGTVSAQHCRIRVELEIVLLLCFCQSSSSGMCVFFLCRPLVSGWLCDHGSAGST